MTENVNARCPQTILGFSTVETRGYQQGPKCTTPRLVETFRGVHTIGTSRSEARRLFLYDLGRPVNRIRRHNHARECARDYRWNALYFYLAATSTLSVTVTFECSLSGTSYVPSDLIGSAK